MPMTDIEHSELVQHEEVIEAGLQTFYEVGTALLAIRDKRLYRAEFGTFEDYCRDRWGFNDRRASQLIQAASVIDNLKKSPILLETFPQISTQAQELSKLETPVQIALSLEQFLSDVSIHQKNLFMLMLSSGKDE